VKSYPRRVGVAALALALAQGLTACTGSAADTPATEPGTAGSRAGSGPGGSSAPHAVNVMVTADQGCVPDTTHLAAGPLTVTVTNRDAAAVSEIEVLSGERIVGEKENLPPGFNGTFTVSLTAGTYTLYCPGAPHERSALTVTGTATGAADSSLTALWQRGTVQYGRYVDTQLDSLVETTTALARTLHGGDLDAARAAYLAARPAYEKIEPVAESFATGGTDLDAAIDARMDEVPAARWTGFHAIEKGLFADGRLTGLGRLGDGLVRDVRRLRELAAHLRYQPFELANGAQELLDEVARSKITGEEERYSHTDLLDVQANVEGAEQAFAALQPALVRIDPTLTGTITSRFAALHTVLDRYRDARDPSGFVRFGQVTAPDKRALSAAVTAVQEPLSRVASKATS